jgi:hypothetical protein
LTAFFMMEPPLKLLIKIGDLKIIEQKKSVLVFSPIRAIKRWIESGGFYSAFHWSP